MRRYRQYVYDLQDVIEGLRAAAAYQLTQSSIEAWILDELRLAYKVQDVMPDDTIRLAASVHEFNGWGKLRQVTMHHLLLLFDPMSHEYYKADYADLMFRHAVLTVSLYSYNELSSGRCIPIRLPRQSPYDEEPLYHAQSFHGERRHRRP
jgi:hypothetical protein